MISRDVRSRIETAADRIGATTSLFKRAAQGRLTQSDITDYLYNILYLFRQTTICLSHAADRARELGQNDLADFFVHKQEEEAGHDKWAQADLGGFGLRIDQVIEDKLNPALLDLIGLIREEIGRSPAHYLGYMVFAEYITVLLAPRLLSNLESKCSIPRDKMSAIAKHEELDRDHADEGFEIIDRFLSAGIDTQAFFCFLDACMHFAELFFDTVGDQSDVRNHSSSLSAAL